MPTRIAQTRATATTIRGEFRLWFAVAGILIPSHAALKTVFGCITKDSRSSADAGSSELGQRRLFDSSMVSENSSFREDAGLIYLTPLHRRCDHELGRTC